MSQALLRASDLGGGVSAYVPRVIPINHAILTHEQRGLLTRLDRFEAPYLQEKLLEKGKFKGPLDYNVAFTEFKKYAGLTQISPTPIGMTSKEVDGVWHQFILFTREYGQFCDQILGRFLHHRPKTSLTPLAEGATRENFVNSYRAIFGELPSIWNSDSGQPCTNCCEDGCSEI